MSNTLISPVGKMLISAFLFVTMPILVFFIVQSKIHTDLTASFKSSTSEAISAVASIITAHLIIGYFLYTAYTYEKSKTRQD